MTREPNMTRRRCLRLGAGLLIAAPLVGTVGCADQAGPMQPPPSTLPGDQEVFSMLTAGGLMPAPFAALASPGLVLYGDGRLLEADFSPDWRAPVRYRLATVSAAAVADFAANAEADGTIDPGTDFGLPPVSDVGETTVLLHGAGAERQASIYAFSEEFENSLTSRQRRHRAAVRNMIAAAKALVGDNERTDYLPDRVLVFEQSDPYGTPEPATVAWPGPDPATFLNATRQRMSDGCGQLKGGIAATVYRAALANPGGRWKVNGKDRTLLVNPLPGRTNACH